MEFIAVIIDLWKLSKIVVVTQLAEWLFSTPEVCSSHQIVGDFLHKTFTVSQLSWKRAKLKKNEADNGQIKNLTPGMVQQNVLQHQALYFPFQK